MVTTREETRALVFGLETKTWSLAAIGALFEGGLIDVLKEPCTLEDLAARCRGMVPGRIDGCLRLAAANGVVREVEGRWVLAEGVKPFLVEPARAALAGEIRTMLMQAVAFLDSAAQRNRESGWRHTDRSLLEGQGATSGGFPPFFKAQIVPSLGDLGERLERPGARFLDVGVGVARLSISMCRTWPMLSAVGIDPFERPLGIARENVAEARLEDRIELRRMGIEELKDESTYDVAWLPAPFLPSLVLKDAIARSRAALKPGGWLIMAVLFAGGTTDGHAAWGLMNEIWGGATLTKDEAVAMVRDAGFDDVRAIEPPAIWAPPLVVARR
jgi:hypothetical protein